MAQGRRKRVQKARLLAYPSDWWYCLAIGFAVGFIVALVIFGGA